MKLRDSPEFFYGLFRQEYEKLVFLGRKYPQNFIFGESMEQKEKKKMWKWLVIAVALIFFIFMAILPFAWEDGDDVPAPNPTIEN